MKGKVLLKGLFLLVCMLMLSVSAVLAQDPCEGIDIDGDGSVVLSPEACDLGDRYGQCTLTEEACANDGDCLPGQCSETGEGCTVAGDCPINVCPNGAACTIDDDCPAWSQPCILSQTCDPVAQTCPDISWCSQPPHYTDIECTSDADCNDICSFTSEPCVTTDDCSFGFCIVEAEGRVSTCIDFFTCEASGTQCVEDGDCEGQVCEDVDNCPATPNPGQENSDGDSLGNACDNCPNVSNENQADSDGNGIGDACEGDPIPPTAVPTLSEWGMIIFMMIILGITVVVLLRRRMV